MKRKMKTRLTILLLGVGGILICRQYAINEAKVRDKRKMLQTLEQRQRYIERLKADLRRDFPQPNYQVWVFGSFLTKRFIPGESDINVAVYSEKERIKAELRIYLKEYFKKDFLDNKVIDFKLSDQQYINIPIAYYGEPLMGDDPPECVEYMEHMIAKLGKDKIMDILRGK